MKIKKNIAVSESGFIFDPTSGESYSLNPVGTEIVNLLKNDRSYEEIKEVILQKYDVDDISFEKYYFDFINMLKQFNLIEHEE